MTRHAIREESPREGISISVFESADAAARELAAEIAILIRQNKVIGRPTVLGLATGSTPVRLYGELVRLHREEGLSFRSVVTFNLDEYHGLPRMHPRSYWRFMHDRLFDHVDILAENVNIPDGMTPFCDIEAHCQWYEQRIREVGGLDFQLVGVGRNGHIGFNEPGSAHDSVTRLVTLSEITRRDAGPDFQGEHHVPRRAISMGVGTILAARRIVLLALGQAKARIVADAIEKSPMEMLPASLLQKHSDTRFFLDCEAASAITRSK